MDIDALRDPQIRLHGLTKADAVYTFYHDETNNVRKLELKPGGFNVATLKVFVLGGVVHDGARHHPEAAEALYRFKQKNGPVVLLTNAERVSAFFPEHTMVDGVLHLTDELSELRPLRHIRVLKMRGTASSTEAGWYWS